VAHAATSPIGRITAAGISPLLAHDVSDYGYDYPAVCVFVELIEGYQLPSLRGDFYADTRHFRKIRDERVTNDQGKVEAWGVYSYNSPGLSGEVLQRPDGPVFLKFRLSSERLPRLFRSKKYVLDLLAVSPEKSAGDSVALACETHTVTFRTDHDQIQYIDFYNAPLL
jgi:hypothetical protein